MSSVHIAKKTIPNFLLWLAYPLLALVIIGFTWRPLVGGDDFWAHASIGRWIIDHQQIPTKTLFLWSESSPWIAHAWGTGVTFATLMQLGGERGGPYLVLALSCILTVTPFTLLWFYWRRNAPYATLIPVLFVLAIWVGGARYRARPELFTALFLTLLLLFLNSWPKKEEKSKWATAGIVVMFAIWPNMHGAVALGVVLLWLTAICECVQSKGDLRLPALAAICTLVVFLCNPRGFEYYQVFLPIASETFKKIDEWKPFWKWPQLGIELVIGEVLLWVTALSIWFSSPNRRYSQLLWLLMMGTLFIMARRQLWMTALTSLAVIVACCQRVQSDFQFRAWRRLTKGDVNEPIPAPMRLIARVGVLIVLICAVAQAITSDFLPLKATSKTLDGKDKIPINMAAFLLNKAPQGRIFNDYEFSSYLEWALHDRRKLYIDLNNAYPDSLMDEYFDATSSSKDKKKMKEYDDRRTQILARRKIEVVALRPYTKAEGLSILGDYLDKNKDWKRLYKEIDGTVWARVAS